MKRRWVCVTIAVLAVACCSEMGSALADAGGDFPDVYARQGEGETDLTAKKSSGFVAGTTIMHSSAVSVRHLSAPTLERLLVPACPGNQPMGDDPTGTLCASAVEYCATVGQQGIFFWQFTRPVGGGAGWRLAGQLCLGPHDAAAVAAAPIPVVTAKDFRRLPLPAGVVHVQPGGGRTLVNVPTNVYLDASTRIIPTVVLGQPIQVRAIPVSYRWSFGDGGGLTTADPGAPYPDLRTTHVYTAVGIRPIGLTTTYRGEYSVGGGGWLPIDGTAQVATPPVSVTVVGAHGELVDAPLPS
jgi:hypothetical protein